MMQIIHEPGRSIEVFQSATDQSLWRYVYSGCPKPYFHPLRTPGGCLLSEFEPADHTWHRGLWFTFKYVNTDNFWEEKDGPFGQQVTVSFELIADGSTTADTSCDTVEKATETAVAEHRQANRQAGATAAETVTLGAAGSFAFRSKLEWRTPDGRVVIDEQRTVSFASAPADDAYTLDFQFELTPRVDVKLDRTPFTTWGGYGGLTLRACHDWTETELLFDDGTTNDRPTPKISRWCALTSKLGRPSGESRGLAMFDHPSNIRYPTPWYGGTGPRHYFNAAMLFNEPLDLSAGELLRLRYRVLVYDGVLLTAELNRQHATWVEESAEERSR